MKRRIVSSYYKSFRTLTARICFFQIIITGIHISHGYTTDTDANTNRKNNKRRKNVFDNLRKGSPITIQEELGKSPTFQYEFFDPLGLATDNNFATYREAELKHGRIAMLATIGMVIPSWSTNNNNVDLNSLVEPQSDTINAVLKQLTHPSLWWLSPSNNLHFVDVPVGMKALQVVPWQGWLQIIVFVGLLETLVFVQKSEVDMPGDYQTGYFGLIDKGKHERSLLVELEHGRLAMVAFMLQVFLELLTGQNVVQLWK